MLSTPSTSHISSDAPIYPPSEDSYLLLDSLSLPQEITFLTTRFPPTAPTPLLLEIGTGSGIVTAFTLQHAENRLFHRPILGIAVDVNTQATSAAKTTILTALEETKTETQAKTKTALLSTLTADLTTCVRRRTVDVLIFNPPYVPTDTLPMISTAIGSEAQQQSSSSTTADDDLLSLSYGGGIDGMEVTDRVLASLDEVLSERGVFYLLLCKRNKPAEVAEKIRTMDGGDLWEIEMVIEKSCGWEILSIWRIWRKGT